MNDIKWQYYWHIQTTTNDIWLHADVFTITDGNAIFSDKKGIVLFAISTGNWIQVNAASVLTGAAVCIEHIDQVEK